MCILEGCEEERDEVVDCIWCTSEDHGLLRALLVPYDGNETPHYIHLSPNWEERVRVMPEVLLGGSLQMRVVCEDDYHRMLVYFVSDPWHQATNGRIPIQDTICGDAIITLLSLESGIERSLPQDVDFHHWFTAITRHV